MIRRRRPAADGLVSARLASLTLVVALLAAPVAGEAQTRSDAAASLEELTREVSRELRCPTCQGLSIEDSPSELAARMRATVREQLAAGRTPEQVKAYFVNGYGEWILLEPEPSGFNLLVYLLPLAALLAGMAVVTVAVRRWTGANDHDSRSTVGLPDATEAEPVDSYRGI